MYLAFLVLSFVTISHLDLSKSEHVRNLGSLWLSYEFEKFPVPPAFDVCPLQCILHVDRNAPSILLFQMFTHISEISWKYFFLNLSMRIFTEERRMIYELTKHLLYVLLSRTELSFSKSDILLVPGYKHSVYIFSRVEVIKPISQCIYCFKMYCQVILLVSKFAMYMYRNPKIKRVCLSKMQLKC